MKSYVSNRNAGGDAQGKPTTPKDFSARRADAISRRITNKERKALKQEPSAQKPAINSLTSYQQTLQQDLRLEDEEQRRGDLFDTESKAADDFDVTKSSIDFDEGHRVYNGNGADSGTMYDYQSENHYAASQDLLQHGQHHQEIDEQNGEEYHDDGFESSDESRERFEGDDGDDRTMNGNEILGIMQRNQDPKEVLAQFSRSMQQNPKYVEYTASMSGSFPLRKNGPNHFAHQSIPAAKSAYWPQQTLAHIQHSAPKMPLSPLPSTNQKYQHESNDQNTPIERYMQRRTNAQSPTRQGNDWGSQPDNLSNEYHAVKGPFAPSIDSPEDLLPPMQPKSQFPGGEHSSEVLEVNTEFIQPDYEEDVLYGMDYAALRKQPFDAKPGEHPPQKSSGISPAEASLEDRLRIVSKQPSQQQGEYFSQMPKEEWEKSGDWFIDQFTDLMKKMKEARQSKRDIAKQFEDVISSREDAVKGKTEGIERVLKEMRTGGEGVLRRKM